MFHVCIPLYFYHYDCNGNRGAKIHMRAIYRRGNVSISKFRHCTDNVKIHFKSFCSDHSMGSRIVSKIMEQKDHTISMFLPNDLILLLSVLGTFFLNLNMLGWK